MTTTRKMEFDRNRPRQTVVVLLIGILFLDINPVDRTGAC
jgi:hypothetical protein